MKTVVQKIKGFWLSDSSFVLLLAMLVFVLFVMPILVDEDAMNIRVMNILFLALYFISVFSSKETWLVYLSAGLFLIHLILQVIRFDDSPNEFYLIERLVGLVNISLFIFINFRLLFRDAEVNVYRIIGAINVYLLFALMGAFVFELIHISTGTSLGGNLELQNNDKDLIHFVYYSLASLTTVGYGDVYPIGMATRMVSVLLSSIGMLYPAVIIAQLVSHRTSKERSDTSS